MVERRAIRDCSACERPAVIVVNAAAASMGLTIASNVTNVYKTSETADPIAAGFVKIGREPPWIMLPNILEVERLVSPSSEPHAVAIDGNLVYLSSRDTKRIDVMELGSWTKIEEIVPPGMPWGMTLGRAGW